MFNMERLAFIFVILISFFKYSICLNVKFREFYDAKVEPFNTQIYKRELTEYFDKASYSFNGFQKIESVPVLFPVDICIMNLNGIKYAAALHMNNDGVRNFAVFKYFNDNYELLTEVEMPNATAMDCNSLGSKGFVAIAFNITMPIENAKQGSPIYQIVDDRIRAVQYFAAANLISVHLRVTGNDLFLLQTFKETEVTQNLDCPYFKWSGSTFNRLGRIPCSNSRHVELFSINYENYVAVANYADHRGRTSTDSEIYKYDNEKKKFQLFQKIKTHGAVDVRHFRVQLDEVKRHHYLVFGNTLSRKVTSQADDKNLEADSVFYVFDKGQFVPYQRLSLYAVEQFLPVQNMNAEKFLLLVACTNQDTKIYNLNDWKFEESDVQFTEGALGKGFSNMRIYQENDNSYLVIANELMTANDTNTFLPIYKQDEHANAVRQQIIDWAKTSMERLARVDVNKLKQDVEKKIQQHQESKAKFEVTDIPQSNIGTVVTKSLVYPRLHLTTNYWKALKYANQAFDALQAQSFPKRMSKREVHERNPIENAEYEYEHINVGTLVIREKLQVDKVNGIEAINPQFKNVTAKKVIVKRDYNEPNQLNATERTTNDDDLNELNNVEIAEVMNVKNLKVTGKINQHTWDDLLDNTLKRIRTIQFITAPTVIGNLEVETIAISSDEVSGRNLAKLISINAGNYVIDQDVKFTAPVIAKNVVINERLNNIHVHRHKFDVLLKRSNETQVITGAKNFANVKVMEPVTTAQGPMLGKQLESMSANKVIIHDDIILNGDYTITGDVTISKILRATDIIDVSANASVKDILNNGIRFDETLENIVLNFEQPLEVNNSWVSFVNAVDLQELVKVNYNEIQIVEGEKTFKNNLEIRRGFSEANFLNGINIENLEKRLFLKHANQTIKIPMHFGKIIAKGTEAQILELNHKNISAYLTKSYDQHIQGTLKVNKLSAQSVNAENLNTDGKIFDADLSQIYQQKAKSTPTPEIFQKNRKFYGSIYVKNLCMNSTINGRDVHEIERKLIKLKENIKYVGNFKFNYDMNITNLTFHGKLNGIPAEDFGLCWLQRTDVLQSFTAPQTLSAVNCEKGVLLEGKINGYKTEEFFTNAIWINRDEHINDAIFQNPIKMQGSLQTNVLNGIRIPEDVLFSRSLEPQVLHADAFVQQNLFVKNGIINVTTVNGINLLAFDRYLSGYGYDTLHLEHANFIIPPIYKTLNHLDLKKTLDLVWLENENVNLQNHVEISDANFEGLLEFEGPINNMDLKYLKENYFSLSRPQDITAALSFTNDTIFEKTITTEDLQLFGSIIDSQSQFQFDFNEFVSNSLKTDGPHEICAVWSIPEAIVQGDLHGVHINNLNLVNDTVRSDIPSEITAPKRINSATIEKLYASPISSINDVDVTNWINDAVYLYENYTIHGVTTIDTVNVYNDLQVDGTVNNVTFDEHTLLLRDNAQEVQGDVRVHNKLLNEQRILVNNFENLHTESINGINITKFMANQAKLNPELKVQGHLVFTQPLLVQKYRNSFEDNGGGDQAFSKEEKPKRGVADDGYSNETIGDWNILNNAVQNLKKAVSDSPYILDHYEIRQVLSVNTTEIIPLTIHWNESCIDIFATSHRMEDEFLKFYRWQPELQQFAIDETTFWLPQEDSLIRVLKVVLDNEDVTVKKSLQDSFYRSIISNTTDGLREVLQVMKQYNTHVVPLEIIGENCFALHGNESKHIPIYCLMLQKENSILKMYQKDVIRRENVKQIVALPNTRMALLFADAVEIWNTNSFKSIQRITVLNPVLMTVGVRDNATYLAVMSDITRNSLHHGAIEIYSSKNAESHFQHLQTVDCIEPLQIVFVNLKMSDDLLLLSLTATSDQPLIIHQFKGIAGFEKTLGTSVLPVARRMQFVELKATRQHLIALLGSDEITFVEIILKQI